MSTLELSNGSKLTIYADDILLYKPIGCPGNYIDLQNDIDLIFNSVQHNYLNLNSSKCKYIIASRKRHPVVPIYKLHIEDDILEQVESYRYFGVIITSKSD